MRITQSMYYKSLYETNNSQLNNKLFDVNKQIASGIKIQYAHEDVTTFAETMRLDNEINTLDQIKSSTENGYKVSNQTDVILNSFVTSMNRMRTLLLQAANSTNDSISLNAIAAELRGKESHLKNLANTSINGQYLFSGSAVDVKPISEDGSYNGNSFKRNSFLGSHTHQQYNISGGELFLGEEVGTRREISSNVIQSSNVGTDFNLDTTMDDFMGVVPAGRKHNFYLRGMKSDGTAINQKIQLDGNNDINALLTAIGASYGNIGVNKVVNVSMNKEGQIVVEDKLKGSSKLDFHMVGASDFGGTDESDVANINLLSTNGTTNYTTALTSPNQLYIREFNKSGFVVAAGATGTIGDLQYDRTMFSISGNTMSSNSVQINKETNAFAIPSTKLSEVADLSQGTSGTLDGTQLIVSGTTANTGATFTLEINMKNTVLGGTTYSLDGGITNYNLYDVGTPRVAVNADDMTYQQLMDVVNLAVTGSSLPITTNNASEYDDSIKLANAVGDVSLSRDGRISFTDLLSGTTKATIAIHDTNSGSFNAGEASVLTFNTNNSLTIKDPKTDFFKAINNMITSVENYNLYPNHTLGNQRVVGIENAIAMMDDLQDHIFSSHSRVGANSNSLNLSLERTELLKLSTKSLRSQVIDTDLATAALTLTQLTLNYEAMLSTVGKISKLSLVNYL